MELRKAEMMLNDLMKFHGLESWHFQWMRAKATLGKCSHAQRTIYLSGPITFAHTEAQVLNTILHEIAHAIVGGRHGHDYVWKMKAIEIGCDGNRTSQVSNVVQQTYKWKYSAACGSVFLTNRRLQNLENRWCKCCHGKLTLSANR